MDTNTLAHYGVLGMKWGIRRTPAQLERASPSGKKTSELSDAELQRRIDRLNMERRYKDLTKPEAKKKSARGKEFCESVLKDVGKNVVENLGRQVIDYYDRQS